MKFFRFCERCGRKFRPTGKHNKICENCQLKSRKEVNRKQKGKNNRYVNLIKNLKI